MSSYTKKKIVSLLAPVLSGLKVYKLFNPNYAGLGHILTFHRVVPKSDKDRIHNHLSLEISPEHLEETIGFYKKEGYKFLSLDQVCEVLESNETNEKFVAFTFDDGYKDNFTVAYPILKKHKIPFTIYVTTNFPDHKAILWWYILEETIIKNDEIDFVWKGKEYQFKCQNTSEKELAFDQIRSLINQNFELDHYEEFLKIIFKKSKEELYAFAKTMAMSWEEIKKISRDPLCTIGAHTINHYPLSQLNEDELVFEINESKERIEKYIGKVVEHFAYPFGKKTEASLREFDAVKALQFKTGTTTRIGNIFKAHKNNKECLPRISINRVTDHHVLKLQSSGLLPFIIHKGKRVILD